MGISTFKLFDYRHIFVIYSYTTKQGKKLFFVYKNNIKIKI